MPHIPELKALRLKAELSQAGLARLANIDAQTVSRAENGYEVQDAKCAAIIRAVQGTEAFKTVELNITRILKNDGKNGPMPKKGKKKKST